MDFPDDITTNVFRVDDIKEIHWVFYTRRRQDESALQNPPSSEKDEDLAQFLQSSEHILRDDGYHVLLDKNKAGVWVFSLSQALDEGIARTWGIDGLEITSFGYIQSGDLATALSSNVSAPPVIKTARSIQPTIKVIEELNTQAYGSNGVVNAQPSTSQFSQKPAEASQGPPVSEVYSNLISAISRSLSHSLGKRRGWLQVDPYACIDARTLGNDLFDNPELNSWKATTNKVSFDVKLLSSGTLLISFFQIRLPRLIRMSKILSRDSQTTGLAIGSPLLLSPSGIMCHYLGTESSLNSEVQRKSTARTKALILSHLYHQGIRPMQEVLWVYVQMDLNVPITPPVSLWPADLCLCEDSMTLLSAEGGELYGASLVDGSVDPLEEAESWFLAKPARMETSRLRSLQENQRAEALSDIQDTEDEDAVSSLGIPVDQGITPQDVSGIYPTPPDGLPPALVGSSNPNNLPSGDYEDEEKGLRPSDDTRGDYDGLHNDDLFGDVDIDMFASNGLTEADFSFFDEPGMVDEDLRETGQDMALDDMKETTGYPAGFDGPDSTATQDRRADCGSDPIVTKDREDVKSVRGSDQKSIPADNNLLGKNHNTTHGSAVSTQDVDYEAIKQLNLHSGAPSQNADGGHQSSFEHVPFQRYGFNLDDKYNMQGRFAFDVDELPITKDRDRGPYPEDHIKNLSVYLEESPTEDSVNTDDEEEDTSASEELDLDNAINLSMGSQAEPSRKRKREQCDENDRIATPSSSVPQAESAGGSPRNNMDESTSNVSKSNALEQAKDMADVEARTHGNSGSFFTSRGHALIRAAQLIAHQAVSGLLQSRTDPCDGRALMRQSVPDQALQNTVTQFLKAFFPTNKRCNLKEYASLGEKIQANASRDQVLLHQRAVKPTHIAGGLIGTGKSIFKLESPYTRVRRNGVSTEVSASALSFWEELSLGPAHEAKDIDAFCVCPKTKCIEEGVMAFLGMIKGAYQSCNLGIHDIGSSFTDSSLRIVTVPMDARKPEVFLQDIAATCEELGTKLPELGLQNGTTIIYIINPFKEQQYLPRLCDALSRLPNSYGAAREKRRPERQVDLVMQIVPLDLVWSSESIVMPSPAEYRRLAFEIYNQCAPPPSSQIRESDYISAPAICLARPVPKTIDFKLVPESSAPLMQLDSCVHVAYAWDSTSEWLVAIWTDNLGVLSWRAAYRLGKNEGKPWKPFYEVVKEILETSFDMLQPPNAPWQLFVCTDRPMLKQENDVWLNALADSSRPSISCTIVIVDADPRVTFTYTDLQSSSSDAAPGLLATPGATPQTNTPSPDISGLSSTPAGNAAQVGTPPPNTVLGDHDSEARLIDITDEAWGVVMDGTLDADSTLLDKCTSMACGYLVKRAGSRDEDGLIPLGVNLVHGQKPYRAALKEVLRMYRNLATLARVRGVVDPVKSVLPLHVAAARKAWKAISETMRFEYE